MVCKNVSIFVVVAVDFCSSFMRFLNSCMDLKVLELKIPGWVGKAFWCSSQSSPLSFK